MTFEVNFVPWSLTINSGLPRRATSAVSSRATRLPGIDVSTTAVRQKSLGYLAHRQVIHITLRRGIAEPSLGRKALILHD
jgi:hypothetical protein